MTKYTLSYPEICTHIQFSNSSQLSDKPNIPELHYLAGNIKQLKEMLSGILIILSQERQQSH